MLQNLSRFWERIQGNLFPWLEEELPPLTKKQQQLVATLEIIQIEHFIPTNFAARGRPQKNRAALARAFIAKAVYNMPTTAMLIERLHSDISLRRICGWENRNAIPHKSVFSRAFHDFAKIKLPQKVHEALIKNAYRDPLVGHVSRDATAIVAREKAHKKKKYQKNSDHSTTKLIFKTAINPFC